MQDTLYFTKALREGERGRERGSGSEKENKKRGGTLQVYTFFTTVPIKNKAIQCTLTKCQICLPATSNNLSGMKFS